MIQETIQKKKRKALEYFIARLLASAVGRYVAKIILFGSVAEDDADEGSDVDVLVFSTDRIEEVRDACGEAEFETTLASGESVESLIYSIGEYVVPWSVFVRNAIQHGEVVFSMEEDQVQYELARNYRDLAEEYLEIAEDVLAGARHRGVVDMAYNAAELCMKGLLILKMEAIPKRHGGVAQKFGEFYVRTGVFPPEIGRNARRFLSLRNSARYDFQAEITREHAEKIIAFSRTLLEGLDEALQQGIAHG